MASLLPSSFAVLDTFSFPLSVALSRGFFSSAVLSLSFLVCFPLPREVELSLLLSSRIFLFLFFSSLLASHLLFFLLSLDFSLSFSFAFLLSASSSLSFCECCSLSFACVLAFLLSTDRFLSSLALAFERGFSALFFFVG